MAEDTIGYKCPKCGGFFRAEPPDELKCLNCGLTRLNTQARHRWLEGNREDIISDCRDLGRGRTIIKWQLTASTLSQCLARWGVSQTTLLEAQSTPPAPKEVPPEKVVKVKPAEHKVAASPKPTLRASFPTFPPFDASWGEVVQVAWLGAYVELLKEFTKEGGEAA